MGAAENEHDRVVEWLQEVEKINKACLEPFWGKILDWSFFSDLRDDRAEMMADGEEAMLDHARCLHGDLIEFGDKFDDADAYFKSIEPLFFHEARMQIARSKSELGQTEEIHLEGIHYSDKFPQKEEKNFLRIDFNRDALLTKNIRYMKDDLVLLSAKKSTTSVATHRLCIVDNSVGNTLSLICYMHLSANEKKMGGNCSEMTAILKNDAKRPWYVTTITSLSTLFREFRALMALKMKKDMPLRKMLLNSSATASSAEEEVQAEQLEIPAKLEKELRRKFNDSQFKAMKEIFKKPFGITLVQGPPGTGKTSTIMGITASLLHAKPVAQSIDAKQAETQARLEAQRLAKKARKPLPEISDEIPLPRLLSSSRKQQYYNQPYLQKDFVPWYDDPDLKIKEITAKVIFEGVKDGQNDKKARKIDMSVKEKEIEIPQKVLICAPSNAAIDEIVRRLVKVGIPDPNGDVYKPSVVRLGPNVSSDLNEWALNTIVERKVKARGLTKHDNPSELKMEVLTESRVVCCTLSVGGSKDLLEYPDGFDLVVIDEAAQAVEVSTLIPLQMGCKRLVLIGDPLQLPATVFAAASQQKKYNRSLFERLQASGHGHHVLSTQYRMHPDISRFPSKYFYDSKLKDADNMMQLVGGPEKNAWYRLPVFKPLMFFDMKGLMYSTHQSWKNVTEIEFIGSLIFWLKKLFPGEGWDERIGVISPYQSQVKGIQKHLNHVIFQKEHHKDIPIKVATVDGFQGSEKDIIILTTVRSGHVKGIGFVDDVRRMNVSLTRPRLNLWVVGDAHKLSNASLVWKGFVHRCYHDGGLVNVSKTKPHFKVDGDMEIRTFIPKFLRDHFKIHDDRWYPENELFEKLHDGHFSTKKYLDKIGVGEARFELEADAELPKDKKDKEKKDKDEKKPTADVEKKDAPTKSAEPQKEKENDVSSNSEASDVEMSDQEMQQGRFNSDGEWEPVSDNEDALDPQTAIPKQAKFFELNEDEHKALLERSQDASKLLADQNADHLMSGEKETTPAITVEAAEEAESASPATKKRKKK